MQRVTSLLPSWDRTKKGSKKGFDKAWGWADKLGAPINKLTNKIGSEAFWPTTLDKESDKAARILRSFCSECSRAQYKFSHALALDILENMQSTRAIINTTQRMDSLRKKCNR